MSSEAKLAAILRHFRPRQRTWRGRAARHRADRHEMLLEQTLAASVGLIEQWRPPQAGWRRLLWKLSRPTTGEALQAFVADRRRRRR